MPQPDPRAFLTDLFHVAVARADPMRVVAEHLPPRPAGRLVVIGAGKASARMAEAVEAHYGPCEGLVITRYGYARPCAGIEIVEAAHPVPDAAGVAATERLLDLVRDLGPEDTVLALISGGGSALLCAPAEGLELADKVATTEALLASGAPISAMNTLRARLSRVKGGRLALACAPARVISLLISDVPGDDPALIASGPTVPPLPESDLAQVLAAHDLPLSPQVRAALDTPGPAPDDPAFATTHTAVIAAPSQALAACAERARAAGYVPQILSDALEGEARDLGAQMAAQALAVQAAMAPGAAPVVLLSGGECTVTRCGDGIGGPNAEFVLAAALALDGAPGIHLLAGDSDGVDGAAEIAGAYAGPDTLARARAAGVDPAQALARNDAHSFFAALDDQLVTGPTLTNVNDIRAILVEAP